jgi:subtilisin-like proprotein convertase family protein
MPSPIEKSRGNRSWNRKRSRKGLARKPRLRRTALENLEPRTLMAVLPTPTHNPGAPNPLNLSGNSSANYSAPTIAVDPANPKKLAAAWVDFNPGTLPNPLQSIIQGAYSNDGGLSWHTYGVPSNILDPTTSNPTIPFVFADTPNIAFDRQNHFYLLSDQHNSGSAAGAFVLTVYDFSGSQPTRIPTPNLGTGGFGGGSGAVSEWESNPETNPQLIVDNNVDSSTDPTTGLTQTDPFGGSTNIPGNNVGNVYVAWDTNYAWPFQSPVPPTYNPNRIKVVGSSNGGQTFGTEGFVDNTGFQPGSARYVASGLSVAQGRAPTTFGPSDRGVAGGLVSVGFDDFNTGANASIPFDVLLDNRVTGGIANGFANTTPVTVPAAPMNGTIVGTSSVTVPNPYDSRFTTLSDIAVTVNVSVQNLGNLQLELQAPDGTKYALTNTSLTGNNLGIDGNGNAIGTTFDLNALAQIGQGGLNTNAPYIGNFRPVNPAAGEAALASAKGRTGNQVAGTWNLVVTNSDSSNAVTVVNWTLHLTSGMINSSDTVINAQNYVRDMAPVATAAMPLGVTPSMAFAFDNTLGSYSQHEGRLYAAFVDTRPAALGGIYSANPADNTDIYLKVSDDGGVTWSSPSSFLGQPNPVNDDHAATDGFSEATTVQDTFNGTASKITGRPQFEPSVAVDPTTGTLAVSYLDTRYDPSRARVATMIATSLDGGATFAPQTFANLPNQALDEITRQQVTLGPIPDNESGGNNKREGTYGFGPSQGLAFWGGNIYPAWSSNQNGGPVDGNSTLNLSIAVAPMVTAAGPRIISSTMGPIKSTTVDGATFNNGTAADGTPEVNGFVVIFDRPVDYRTFDQSSVQVQYRSPTTPVGQAGTPVAVSSVTPLNLTGPQGLLPIEATTFLVTFTQPQSAIGTYSYEITPGAIRDVVRSNPVGQVITPGPTTVYNATGSQINLPVPSQGTGGTGTQQDFTTSQIPVTNIPVTSVISHVTVTVQVNHTSDRDLVMKLIAPDGTAVTLVQNLGGSGHNYNTTTFDDTAALSITQGSAPFNGTFRPQQSLDGTLKGRTAFGTWTLQIQDTQPGDTGTLLGWSLSVQRGTISYQPTQQAGNLMDQNANGVPGESTDFYATPMPVNGGAAFQAPYDPTTLPLIVTGPHVIGTQAVLGNGSLAPVSGDNLVTDNTVSGLDVTFDRDMNPATFAAPQVLRIIGPAGLIGGPINVAVSPANADPTHIRTFRITFPTQQLSGTYTLTLASTIQSAAGDKLDSNLNAGVDVLRGFSPGGTTTPITASAVDTPVAIPPQKTVTSQIVFASNFPIQGATLQLNITDKFDPDLQATLIALDPNGNAANNISIPLFTGVGSAGTQMDFNNTIFDDNANTPIQNGGGPFFGSYKPQQPLGVLIGGASARTYVLQITNNSQVNTGTLNSWSLTLLQGVPGTGLGEPIADQAEASFRIFTMDPTNPLSSNTWTAVGPAAIGSSGGGQGAEGQSATSRSGRVGGLAIDPSDPSGNTVYVGGASGGIWKTTNFLTTNPAGPTYIPLTNFGPNFAINTGSIAVFGRNNDTNQSIVFAATGEGDTGTPPSVALGAASTGVGVLRSMDGGATWQLLDSTTNVDAQGNPLPINSPQRDHIFDGTVGFKIVVDPKPTSNGGVLAYLAVADPSGNGHGGIYRTVDGGNHWTRVLTGSASDIALDPASGVVNAFNNPTGNLQIIYAAIEGTGVYQSQNEGLTWTQLLGSVGNALFQDISKFPVTPVPFSNNAAPTGGQRIVLAKPSLALSTDPNATAKNALYQGWLYAAFVATDNTLQGLYMTKDFGRNWTKIKLSNQTTGVTGGGVQAAPSNDPRNGDFDPLGNPAFGPQGNYDVSLIVDPNNPNVVYLGGTHDGNATGLIRVDTTGISDPYAFYLGENTTDSATRPNTSDPIGLSSPNNSPTGTLQFPNPYTRIDVRSQPTINMLHDPFNPFSNSTFYTDNATSFSNNGANVRWIPFDASVQGTTDQHRVVAMRDPLTGLTRIIFGDDQGVFSDLVANDGTLLSGIGVTGSTGNPDVLIPTGSRNGNLQITQFYYGAAQASNIAAQIATLRGMFYGNAQDDGFPQSDPNVVQPGQTGYGNLVWTGPGGDGGGVATDQNDHRTQTPAQSTGDVFQYKWPCCGGNITDFFQVNQIGQTSGLVRNIQPGSQVPDPQWPFEAVVNFAVNPLDADQIVISSTQGRVYRTENRGQNWLPIAQPGSDIADSAQAIALAYGAPEPNPPGGTASLDNFIYVGTLGGHVYVTFQGGGPGAWTNISKGLDGSPVEQIVTNPQRGSHEAYAVTLLGGVFHMVDSSAANPTWQPINGPTDSKGNPLPGNLFALTRDPFGNTLYTETAARSLDTIQADWRYVIPDNLSNPGGSTHPLLYVGGQSGVYRSLDGGQTWSLFPDSGTGSLLNSPYAGGGGLPVGNVTDLNLSLGFINPTTGAPDESTGSNVLLATTYGRGSFAIRLAPIVLPASVGLDPNLPAPGGSDSGLSKTDKITNVVHVYIDGLSEVSAFGNTLTVNLIDETTGDPMFGQVIGTGQTDAKGFLAHLDPVSNQLAPGIQITANLPDGMKTIGVQATNASGTKGNIALFSYQLITATPGTPTGLKLDPSLPAPLGSDSGLSQTDNITNITSPYVDVTPTSIPSAGVIQLLRDGTVVNTVPIPANSTTPVVVQDLGATPTDGTHVYTAIEEDVAGNLSMASVGLTITLDTLAPPTPAAPQLLPADDSGVKGDGITNVRQPHLIGTLVPEATDPIAQVQIVSSTGTILGKALSAASGAYSVQFASPLADGVYTVRIQAEDIAGNVSGRSTAFVLQITTKIPTAPTIAVLPSDISGPQGSNITNVNQPHLFGTTDPGVFVDLIDTNGDVTGTKGAVLATTTADGSGNYLVQFPNPLPDGTYHIQTQARDVAGNTALSSVLTLTILTKGPTTAPTLGLLNADDTGIKGDGITVVRRPHLTGMTIPNGVVDVIDSTGTILAMATADASGKYTLQLPHNLTNGKISLRARATDIAGNIGPTSTPAFVLTITTANGDYTNTGSADLALFRPTTGQFFISPPSPASAYAVSTQGQPGDIPIQGDFDGDGKTDVGFYRPSTGTWYIYRSQLGFETMQFGQANVDIPVPGDYTGAGITDLAVYRPTNETWYILTGGGAIVKQFGQAGDIPAPGAYDGNLTTEMAVYRPSTAQFVINGPGNVSRTVQVGTVGLTNVAIPADFDGLGKDEPAIYQPATAKWMIYNPNTHTTRTVTFGAPNLDIPVPRDYDGDGKADLAVFRPVASGGYGEWLVLFSGGGAETPKFGSNTDIPVPEPLSYLASSLISKSRAQAFLGGGAGGGTFGSGGSGGSRAAAAMSFGQPSGSAPVVIPGPSSGATRAFNPAPASPITPPSPLLSGGATSGRRVNVVQGAGLQGGANLSKPSKADNQYDSILEEALTNLGRVKVGKFLN